MLNIKRRKTLTPLEQFLMEYVWAHPDCTAETCREGVAPQRALKDSTIRTILRNLEEKGNVTVEAAQQLIDRFCGGSVEEFLVGLVDNQVLQPKQLQRHAEKIAARKEKKP